MDSYDLIQSSFYVESHKDQFLGAYCAFKLIYITLGPVNQHFNIPYHHSYADDTQLYVSVTANHLGPFNDLNKCTLDGNKLWWSGAPLTIND